MLGNRIWGKRLGIIGMGRIGQAVARRARAFGLQIHYHNRRKVAPKIEEELDATYWESLDQMLARMDIVSVNCPHTPATYHLLSARRLKMMRPEAYIVNTSRGEVIDENALARLLEAGEIAGAGLDVFEHEPAVNPKLVKLARAGKVVLLPHMGSATLEGRVDMGEKVIINIKTFMDGHKPPDRVLASMLDRQILDRRLVAAERVVLVPRIIQRLETHRARVDHQQPPDQAFAKADDLAHHFQRHHRAENAGQRAEDAGFRASRHRAAGGGSGKRQR